MVTPEASRMALRFNPRLREGGDGNLQFFPACPAGFNPRLREGGDRRFAECAARKHPFQSTPPRRRRLPVIVVTGSSGEFQSTPPRRRRQKAIVGVEVKSRFQSTPPRRRRPVIVCVGSSAPLFQSTPPRRRRRHGVVIDAPCPRVSIHASAKEATVYVLNDC